MPNIVGKTQAEADPILEKANLTIGQVQPQPPDPKAKIESQIPAAKEVVKEGKPINIFLATIKDKKNGDKDKKDDGGGGGGGGGGKAAAVTLPALGGAVADAAQAAADAGRRARSRSPSSRAKKKGTVIRTEPPAGTKLKAGDKVKIVVSGGFPELTYDDGKNILLANGANGKRFPAVAKGPTQDTDPTFSADGTQIAYVANRQRLPQGPVEEGRHRGAAHRARRQVQRPRVGADGRRQPDRDAPRQEPGRQAHGPGPLPAAGDARTRRRRSARRSRTSTWRRPSGGPPTASRSSRSASSPTRPASRRRSASSAGRRRSRSPPTPRTGARAGSRATSRTRRKGVIDWAPSPDGKTVAAVANFDSDAFQLYFAKPKDFLLTDAKPQGVRACKVAWRSDGQEIVVVQADQFCAEPNGQLAAHAGQEAERPAAAGLQRRQPRLPAADAGVAVLCTSCRRQLSRGAEYCGNCGTPVAGRRRAARARARGRDARAARRRR